LALLQLDSLPATAKALPLANELPEPGERLLTIAGLPDGSEGLWVMTTGTVRLAYRRNIANGAVTGVVETDLPFNAGNSGGPVVNELGELVAVVEGYEVEARQVSMTIDVGEVRAYLAECDPLIAPRDANAFLERGRRRHNADRWELALGDYAQALKMNPQLTIARLNRGWIFVAQEDYTTAQQEFEAVLKQDPDNASAYDGRGVCYREAGDYDAALQDLTQAIRRASQDASLYFRRANTYREKGEFEKALADMNRAIKYDPDTPDHWATRGQIQRQLKHYEEAAADISKAWKMQPDNFQWIYELAYVHMDFGNNDKAYTLYTLAAELNDQEPRVFNNRGLVLNRLKRYDEALRDFTTAIELNPHKALYYEHAGDTLYYLRRYPQAVELYTKSIDLDADVASAFRGRGDAYQAMKNAPAAEQDYQRAKQLEME
jgi:tetratricopeptide (TPR) repeat protein